MAGLSLRPTSPAGTVPAQEAALKLWGSLSEEQKKQAVRPFEDGWRRITMAVFITTVTGSAPAAKWWSTTMAGTNDANAITAKAGVRT